MFLDKLKASHKSVPDRQINRLAKRLAEVGSQMVQNPVVALKLELESLCNVDDISKNPVANDLAKVPLKYHANLLQHYVSNWRKINYNLPHVKRTDTVNEFDQLLMEQFEHVSQTKVEKGYLTPLTVFDEFMRQKHDGSDHVAYQYLMSDSSDRFAADWLDEIAKMGLDA